MIDDEVIILSLPSDVITINRAAEEYLDQYGVIAQLAVRGTVRLDDGQLATIPTWRTIAQVDRELGLIGIGDFGEADEELLWAVPLGLGELRVAALEEEM